MVARRFYRLFRVILGTRTSGCRHLGRAGPLILVSNHAGSYGPMVVMTSLPLNLHPWVAHEVTELKTAAERIRVEFVEAELHWRPPLSRWVSRVIARICVALMRDLGVVPVYDRSRRIRRTVDRSLRLLEQGRSILVFPEATEVPDNEIMCDLRTGFINLARAYYEKTRRAVSFLPVAVHRRAQRIRVGAPIRFDCSIPFHVEKLKLKRELAGTIYRLYYDIEREARERALVRTMPPDAAAAGPGPRAAPSVGCADHDRTRLQERGRLPRLGTDRP